MDPASFVGGLVAASLFWICVLLVMATDPQRHRCPFTDNWGNVQCTLWRDHDGEHRRS